MRREGSEIMVPRLPSSSYSSSSSSMENDSGLLAERPVTSLPPDRKGRIPKKIHKAEREKLKRNHLNELFQELGQALESSRQNNGKASILGDATKLLHDLISQVDSLRKENAALQNESQYVMVERNELKDENGALGAEIEKLQIEIRSRMDSNPSWSNAAPAHTSSAQPLSTALTIQQPPMVGSMYVVPVRSDQTHVELSDPTGHIRRPHARYPTPADSWPHQILSQHPAVGSDDGSRDTGDEQSGEVPSTPKELLLLI